jgi:hypothetical protein
LHGRRRFFNDNTIYDAHQTLDVVIKILTRVYPDRVSKREGLKTFREKGYVWHPCIADEYRNNGEIHCQRGLDFYTYKIRWIVNSCTTAPYTSHPSWADDGHEEIALTENGTDVITKIDPDRDTVYVPKDRFFAEGLRQSVKNAACNSL